MPTPPHVIPGIDAVEEAAACITGHVHRTPLLRATRLGAPRGVELHLKCENLQKTGSFKPRGALNKLMCLDDDARRRGVVTVSAGNHAQALAWAASQHEVPCVVVMPAGASVTKAEAARGYGAEVVLHGSVFDAFDRAHQLEAERGLTFVHPFDDPAIVAGQGTVGLEILDQLPRVQTIIVPVGGGGQISGIAAYVKRVRPDVRIYGVEPEGADAMGRSVAAGRAVQLDRVDTIADGLAPPMAGELNYRIVAEFVDRMVTVSDDQLIDALGKILQFAKLVVEPAGAAAVAALLNGLVPASPDEVVVCVLTGGNVAPARLGEWSDRWRPENTGGL